MMLKVRRRRPKLEYNRIESTLRFAANATQYRAKARAPLANRIQSGNTAKSGTMVCLLQSAITAKKVEATAVLHDRFASNRLA